MSLYNHYRPQKLSEIIGQSAAKATVKGMLKNNSFPHANLFCGIHGTGKTTMARIISKAVNCQNPTEDGPCCRCESCLAIENGSNSDVVELDAASNNGVADIEAVLEQIRYVPYSKKKVLILDEVHMLSAAAFAKLLKTLEEPPEHVIFILCTTDSHKVPGTIHSRCVELNFKKISDQEIFNNLETICKKEGFPYEQGALVQVTKAANGSVRDSLSILEALALGNQLTEDAAIKRLGFTTDDNLFQLLCAIACENIVLTMEIIDEILENGVNIPRVLKELVDILISVISYHSGMTKDLDISDLAHVISVENANAFIYAFTEILKDGKATGLEMAFRLKCIQLVSEKRNITFLEKRICALEKEVAVLKTRKPTVSETAPIQENVPHTETPLAAVQQPVHLPSEPTPMVPTPNVVAEQTSASVSETDAMSNGFVSVPENTDIPFEMMDEVPESRFDVPLCEPAATECEPCVSVPVAESNVTPVTSADLKPASPETSKGISIPVPGGHINSLLPNADPRLLELLGSKQVSGQTPPQTITETVTPVETPLAEEAESESISEPSLELVAEPVTQTVNPLDGFGSFGNFFPSFARQS